MPNTPPPVPQKDLRLLPMGLYRMAKAILRSVDKRFPVYADSWRIAGLRAEVEKADLALAKPQPAFNAGVEAVIALARKDYPLEPPARGAEQRDAHGYLINEVTAKARDKRPTIAQSMPPEIESKAIERYEGETQGVTGNKWDWNSAGEATQNTYRLRAWIAAISTREGGKNG